jgi:hypothetical protein
MRYVFSIILLQSLIITCFETKRLEAQDNVQETEIYIADVSKSGGKLMFSKPVNISRHAGYDNQPWFSTDSRSLFFSSIRGEKNTTKQHDIYRYSVKDSSISQFTDTPESEFSPMVMPEDGQSVSVVRVEQDSTQRLWKFDKNGKNPTLVLENVRRVGYYAWIGASNLALYIIAEQRRQPPTLQLVRFTDSLPTIDTIEAQCGRCFRRIPSSIALSQTAVSYIHKMQDTVWVLKRANLKNGIVSQVFAMPSQNEDYTWSQNGQVLVGQDLKILARHARKDNAWKEIADFSKDIPKGSIKRIVLSPDEKRIAFVVQE